jgi:phage portal protein BeeE
MVSHFAEARKRYSNGRALTTKAAGSLGIDAVSASGGPAFGRFREEARAKEGYSQFKNWIYVATNAIAKRLAGQPWCAGSVEGATANPERMFPANQKHTLPSHLTKEAANQNLTMLEDHPVLDAFRRPNSVQKSFEFLYLSCINLLITGESYWLGGVKDDGEDGEKLEMWAVPTSWVKPKHKGGMFTSYDIEINGVRKLVDVPPENVARTYFPHPSDLKMAFSPLFAIMEAATIDEHILRSQRQMFERGIYPNMVVTIGKSVGADGKATNARPVLTGQQRRTLVASINQIWNETVNAGEPAILDGMIESIHPLHNTPQEMNWMQSGDSVKRRIMQVYQVNPISVGEIVGANRAQATEAERQICNQAVNPLAEAFSETATDFAGPMYDTPERLEIWIEKAEPRDQELELERWKTARTNNDASKDEYRTNILGLGPDEREYRNSLMDVPGGIAPVVQIIMAVGNGTVKKEVASRWLQTFYEIEEETADKLAGMDLEDDEPAEPATLPPAPPENEPAEGDGEENPEDEEAPEAELAASAEAMIEQKIAVYDHVVTVGETLMRGVEEALEGHATRVKELVDGEEEA